MRSIPLTIAAVLAGMAGLVSSSLGAITVSTPVVNIGPGNLNVNGEFDYLVQGSSTNPNSEQLANFQASFSFTPVPDVTLVSVSTTLFDSAGFLDNTLPYTLSPSSGSNVTIPVAANQLFDFIRLRFKVNSFPVSTTTYNVQLSGVTLGDELGDEYSPAQVVNGSITLQAIPEPLTAAGVLALAGRVLGRRSRWSI